MEKTDGKKQLGIYLHIPFCKRKCLYCDFLSAPAGEETIEAYVEALCRQIEKEAKGFADHKVRTVFVGGGTPSLLTPGQMERLLSDEALYEKYSRAAVTRAAQFSGEAYVERIRGMAEE